MTPTPWTRALSVHAAADELHIGLVDVAELVVSGRIRARVRPGSERPNVWTVEVCAADVSKCRRNGTVQPCPVVDPMLDEFTAQDLLRRRRSRTGWPPPWPGAPKSQSSRSHPSPRRMGMTEADRVREVRAMVRKVSDAQGWAALAVVCRRLAKRAWAEDPRVVRGIVTALVDMGELEERTAHPLIGRPSYQIRLVRSDQ